MARNERHLRGEANDAHRRQHRKRRAQRHNLVEFERSRPVDCGPPPDGKKQRDADEGLDEGSSRAREVKIGCGGEHARSEGNGEGDADDKRGDEEEGEGGGESEGGVGGDEGDDDGGVAAAKAEVGLVEGGGGKGEELAEEDRLGRGEGLVFF